MRSCYFSIIIPVFNRRKELQRCLYSLSKQTVKDFEVIVVDDYSSTTVSDIVDNSGDERFSCIRNEKNGGPYNARTRGWKHSKGDIILHFDSDWEAFPWMLSRAKVYFELFPNVSAVTGMFLRDQDSSMFVRVRDGVRVVGPKEAQHLQNMPDCLGFVKRMVVDEWLEKSTEYFATESHAWLTFSMKHSQLYVDEPWALYHLDAENRVSDFKGVDTTRRIINDHLLFLRDHQDLLMTSKRKDVDNELINRFWFLYRKRHRGGIKAYTKYINHRGMSVSTVILREIFKRLLYRIKLLFHRGKQVYWI